MPFDPGTWYLGWLGELRALPVPEPGLTTTEKRFGGVHESLNGSRTADITGFRTEYHFDFTYLAETDYQWLRALYLRHLRGPHYLINPLRGNLLSPQCSTGYVHGVQDYGWQALGSGYDYVLDYPSAVAPAGNRTFRITNVPAAPGYLILDGSKKFIPVLTGEPVTFSVYLKADAARSITMYLEKIDKFGASIAGGADLTVNVTTSWQRFILTHVPAVDTAALRPGFVFGTAQTYNTAFAAPQVEYGAVATPWDLGGGSTKVVLDQITSTSPRFPLSDVTVTLWEA
ncbi:hypothetical protein OG943_32695 [Amycolatopsis sp. NBC_00345]|uniref:hypothetical protein n=1 Tax=Amycolatopsis sp. NBC_00345 TaxID=2975955 RepID=UPI002E269832